MTTLWRKRQRQRLQQEFRTDAELDTAAVIVAAIIGATSAVILALFFTFQWLK